jgi:hypothetical protein
MTTLNKVCTSFWRSKIVQTLFSEVALRARQGHLPGINELPASRTGVKGIRSERAPCPQGVRAGVVRHVVEVRVVGGEIDLAEAKAQIPGIAREVSREEIKDDQVFQAEQARAG